MYRHAEKRIVGYKGLTKTDRSWLAKFDSEFVYTNFSHHKPLHTKDQKLALQRARAHAYFDCMRRKAYGIEEETDNNFLENFSRAKTIDVQPHSDGRNHARRGLNRIEREVCFVATCAGKARKIIDKTLQEFALANKTTEFLVLSNQDLFAAFEAMLDQICDSVIQDIESLPRSRAKRYSMRCIKLIRYEL